MFRVHPAAVLLAVLVALFLPAIPGWAEEIVVSHTYLMGDSETKNQARAACLAEAKRAILERAGTYSRVVSEMRDFEITRDVVQSFAGAIVKATVIKEEVAMVGQSMALTCTVAGEVDMASLEAQAKRMMEARLPSPAPPGAPGEQRPGTVPGVPKSLPNQPDADLLREKMDLRREMLTEQRDATFLAAQLTEKGMTFDQVAQLAGEPTAQVDGPRHQCLRHGNTWVVYQHGRVVCVRRALGKSGTPQGECHCNGFAGDFYLR